MKEARFEYKRPEGKDQEFANEATIEAVKGTWPGKVDIRGPLPKELFREEVLFNCVQYGGPDHSGSETPKPRVHPKLKVKFPGNATNAARDAHYGVNLYVWGVRVNGRRHCTITNADTEWHKRYKRWLQEIFPSRNAVVFVRQGSSDFAPQNRILLINGEAWQDRGDIVIPAEVRGQIPTGLVFKAELWRSPGSRDEEVLLPPSAQVRVHEAEIDVDFENSEPRGPNDPFSLPGGSSISKTGPSGRKTIAAPARPSGAKTLQRAAMAGAARAN